MAETSILQVQNLSRSVVDTQGHSLQVISSLSFAVSTGQILFVRGPSGVGKSLLLRSLALLDPVQVRPVSRKPQALVSCYTAAVEGHRYLRAFLACGTNACCHCVHLSVPGFDLSACTHEYDRSAAAEPIKCITWVLHVAASWIGAGAWKRMLPTRVECAAVLLLHPNIVYILQTIVNTDQQTTA